MFRTHDDAAHLEPLRLGRYPTPVERIGALSAPGAELWVKRDDRTHEVYGGNKVRKLEWLLADARACGAARVVTVGAVGSHHVLATAYFGAREGLDVEAFLVAQPRTDHVLDVLRAGLARGLRAFAARSRPGAVLNALARSLLDAKTRFIPVGGSSVLGSAGYVAAARELATQVRAGELPEPDVCVVALGSGGTAAGLAAGFEVEKMKTKVVGVCVSGPVWAVRLLAMHLAQGCARAISGRAPGQELLPRSASSFFGPPLCVDARFLGGGYGHRTHLGDAATRDAEKAGLTLDPTYTAKAFASALWHVRSRRAPVILYWHTLSSAPLEPLLRGAPEERSIAPGLRELLLA